MSLFNCNFILLFAFATKIREKKENKKEKALVNVEAELFSPGSLKNMSYFRFGNISHHSLEKLEAEWAVPSTVKISLQQEFRPFQRVSERKIFIGSLNKTACIAVCLN